MTNPPQAGEHIVRSFDEELARLTREIQFMGDLALGQLDAAIDAVIGRDSGAAEQVVRGDTTIDQLEQKISQDVVRVLALRQPIARDLREVLTALRVATDIERIGDYAANIAKRSIIVSQETLVKQVHGLARLASFAKEMVRDVLTAYSKQDADHALIVWARDEELDGMYTSLFRELLTYMMEDPRNITASTHLLFMAKNIERIGDHATNIAENVYFLVRGTPLAQERRKGDRSISVPGEGRVASP